MSKAQTDDKFSSEFFIDEWVSTFSLDHNRKVEIPGTGYLLDYYIEEGSIGIMICHWKKPISVKIFNKAIIAIDRLELNHLFLVCQEVSDYVNDLLNKNRDKITVIHPFGLSEIALYLSSMPRSIKM